jgi:hypothetical protein
VPARKTKEKANNHFMYTVKTFPHHLGLSHSPDLRLPISLMPDVEPNLISESVQDGAHPRDNTANSSRSLLLVRLLGVVKSRVGRRGEGGGKKGSDGFRQLTGPGDERKKMSATGSATNSSVGKAAQTAGQARDMIRMTGEGAGTGRVKARRT